MTTDGKVVGWGLNYYGQTNVPGGLTHVEAIAAAGSFSLALQDGKVFAWGEYSNGQTNVPKGLSDVVSISAGLAHSLALKKDGTVVAWGYSSANETSVPGSADLSGLFLEEGNFAPSFHPSVTKYDSYVSPSVSEVHITAMLQDMRYADLYINNQRQSSDSPVTVNLTGPTTIIPVRVEPYLLAGKNLYHYCT